MSISNVLTNSLLIAGTFATFAVLHSLTAGTALRNWLAGITTERLAHGLYRLTYNVISGITLAVPLALVVVLPDTTLYRVPQPLSYVLIGVQIIGVIGVMLALLQTDLGRFSGLAQFAALISGGNPADGHARLQTGGFYRWMRHPLYVFSLLAIWPLPVMTLNVLIFNIAATLYFTLGAIVEEQRLERLFGDEYRRYKQQVRWIGRR